MTAKLPDQPSAEHGIGCRQRRDRCHRQLLARFASAAVCTVPAADRVIVRHFALRMLRRLAAQHTCSVQHASACIDGVRWLSAIHYDSTSSDVEALLHETLVQMQDAAYFQAG